LKNLIEEEDVVDVPDWSSGWRFRIWSGGRRAWNWRWKRGWQARLAAVARDAAWSGQDSGSDDPAGVEIVIGQRAKNGAWFGDPIFGS
jgi:hypothetical protein